MEEIKAKNGRLDEAIHNFNETINRMVPGELTPDTLTKLLTGWKVVSQIIAEKEQQETKDLIEVVSAMQTNITTMADLATTLSDYFADNNTHDIYAGDLCKGIKAQAVNADWLRAYVAAKGGNSDETQRILQYVGDELSSVEEEMDDIKVRFPGRRAQTFSEVTRNVR